MKLKLLAGAAMAAAFAASGAMAQEGWYGAVDLGYHWPTEFKVTSSNNAAAIAAPARSFSFIFRALFLPLGAKHV